MMAVHVKNVWSNLYIYGSPGTYFRLMILIADRGTESLWHPPPAFLAPSLRSSFSTTTAVASTRRQVKKHDHRDAYALRQAKARKDANLSRQIILKEERAKELGDPIRGIETPFLRSFDNEVSQETRKDANVASVSVEALKANPDKPPPSPAFASNEKHLDHGITHEELRRALESSRRLTEPLPSDQLNRTPERADMDRISWATRDRSALEAVQRIVSLANASNMQRTKKNIARIVEAFGRHNTDETLKPKAAAVVTRDPSAPTMEPTPRSGPDTGSSEVQIGILTAKIRVLADRYEGENRNDKINKRNLRVLLHRRQKLLKYMEKKERGSERWQNMIKTLGLTPATWHGEIAV